MPEVRTTGCRAFLIQDTWKKHQSVILLIRATTQIFIEVAYGLISALVFYFIFLVLPSTTISSRFNKGDAAYDYLKYWITVKGYST